MKKITALTCLAAALFLNLSCEKHSWEDTKMFNQNRTVGAHHGAHGAAKEGEGHAAHAPAAVPAEGHAPAPAPAPVPVGESAPVEKH